VDAELMLDFLAEGEPEIKGGERGLHSEVRGARGGSESREEGRPQEREDYPEARRGP